MHPLAQKNRKNLKRCKVRLSKESDIFPKKHSNPHIHSLSKKSTKQRHIDNYIPDHKCYDSNARRTLHSTSVKNSTRVSENYSNMNTSLGRKKKSGVNSSRSLKRRNPNQLHLNAPKTYVQNSLEKLPALRIKIL